MASLGQNAVKTQGILDAVRAATAVSPALKTFNVAVAGMLRDSNLRQPSAGLDALARSFVRDLTGDDGDEGLIGVPVTNDDQFYDVIASVAPQLAAAIDATASTARLPLLSRRVVRNSLAALVAGLVIAAYVAGVVLLPPYGAIAAALLGANGITAPAAYRRIAHD